MKYETERIDRLTIEIPAGLKKRLRMKVLQNDEDMRAVLLRAVEEYLGEENNHKKTEVTP